MKSLIIVESFTKTKTIKKYINDDNYIVTFTSGHIYNLPKDKLGFDTESWKIDYIYVLGMKKSVGQCYVWYELWCHVAEFSKFKLGDL